MRFAIVAMVGLLTLQAVPSCEDEDPEIVPDPAQQRADVEGWFFRLAYLYPVQITYEPVVLFRDGDYVEVKEQPLEDIDEATDRLERPEAWGTWRMDGDTYRLTDHQGNTDGYQLGGDTWFPAYPYMEDVPLATGYTNTTGGDWGNGTGTLVQTRIDFPQEGYFYHSSEGSIITPGSSAWNETEEAGTYTVAGHTIVMTYNSGEEVRASFALGSEGDPAQPSSDVIFIGGDAYVADDTDP